MTQPQEPPAPPRASRWPPRVARVRHGIRRTVPFASGIVAALVAVILYGMAVPGPRPLSQQDVTQSINHALASVTPPPAYSQAVYQAVQPSVILIEAAGATPQPSPSGGLTSGAVSTGLLGSGVVVDSAGDILTCLHVVAGAASIQVTFADGTVSPATIQSTQAANDIAVLRASKPPSTIVPAVLGNPRSVRVGSEAYVIGNPFGLSGSMSAGVVSALDRTFQLPGNGPKLQGLIQFDAAVNPGSSGGPLVNRNGQVVGIVDALINPTSQDVFIGIGLAVPIDVAGGAAGLPPD